MHGNGNDFILIDEFENVLIPEKKKSYFVRAVCDRRFGVGGDGVIFVQRSDVADAKFLFYNRDGSFAEFCGNGMRCFSRYIVERGYVDEGIVKVETPVGITEVEVWFEGSWWIKVKMGKPTFDKPLTLEMFEVYPVKVGVPHAVIFVDDFNFDFYGISRKIRFDENFPDGVNVNFAKVFDRRKVFVRTYERGVEDETLSCGSGSCAVVAVGNRLGILDRVVDVKTKGGNLRVEINDEISLTGTATKVFEGELFEIRL